MRKMRKRAHPEHPLQRTYVGTLEAAFPAAEAFVCSLKGEADRCLAEQKWRVTDIVEGGKIYPFNNMCVLEVAKDIFENAEKLQLRVQRTYETDGSRKRTGSLDSDVFMEEQEDVLRRQSSNAVPAFVMATQLFSDAAVVLWNGGTLDPILRERRQLGSSCIGETAGNGCRHHDYVTREWFGPCALQSCITSD